MGVAVARLARVAPPGLVVLLAAGSAYALAHPFSMELGMAGMTLGNAAAAGMILRRARLLPPSEARAWRALAGALGAGVLGVSLVGAVEALGFTVPAFGPIDLVFLGGYAALAAGMVRLSRIDGEGLGWRLSLLDTLVGAVSLSVFVWLAIGDELVDNFASADGWSRVIAPLYPIVDVAVVLAVLNLTVRRTRRRFDASVMLLGVGLTTQVVADFAYLSAGLGYTFSEARPLFELFLGSSACYVAAGSLLGRARPAREYPEQSTPRLWTVTWPYLLATGLISTHLMLLTQVELPTDQTVTLIASLLVGALVVLRQVMAIREYRRAVDRQRRELISSVSHELRTPLTAMVGYLELLSDQPEAFSDRERDQMLTTVTDQARHLARVVTDMIALARDGGWGLVVNPLPTTLSSVCGQALRWAGEPHALLMIARDVEVTIDGERIGQALVNLLTNARRYGRGACTLVAATKGSDAVFEVHDDGPGVPVRHQVTMWEQFERGAHRLDASTPGVGVGLAITRAILHSHGGTAGYRASELLGGACFVLTVPSAAPPRPVAVDPIRLAV